MLRWAQRLYNVGCTALVAVVLAGLIGLAAATPAGRQQSGALASGLGPKAPAEDEGAGPSLAVFPPQTIPLRFSHVLHLEKVGLDCVDCHGAAPDSRSSLDLLLPTEAVCRECHEIDRKVPDKEARPAARCDACHSDYDPTKATVQRVRIPFPNIKFSHKSHVDRGMACSGCHGDFVGQGVELATRAQLPLMRDCTKCHDGKRASGQCETCHLTDVGGVLQTDFSSGPLAPSGAVIGARHDLSFRAAHAREAEGNPALCDSCHRKSFCIDCHAGVIKPMDFHVGDYIALHPQEARRNNPECSTCHRQQTFCVGCHSRTGVASDGRGSEFVAPSSPLEGRGFHPPGWVEFSSSGLVTGDGSRGRNHHSFEAQRNIRQCASCHRESFCLGCHSDQGTSFGINPHPRGWAKSRRCRSLLARNGRLCLRCHIDSADVRCD